MAEGEQAMVPAQQADENAEIAMEVDGLTKFKDNIIMEMANIGKQYGGPVAYLNIMTKVEREQFALWLLNTFPEKPNVMYTDTRALPSLQETELAAETPLCVHVCFLGFDKQVSMKPSPGRDLFRQMVDHIMQDGFVTGG